MLNWDDLKVFLAAFREGSIGRAAGRLGVSGSTVSRRLTALEAALGQSLFVRSPDGLKPTAAGTRVWDDAQEAERHVTRMQFGVQEVDELRGSVRVSASSVLLHTVILPNWSEFSRTYPEITVEFVESTELADLERWEADIAIRVVRPQSGDNLVITALRESKMWVFAARALLVERGVDPDDHAALCGVGSSLGDWPWVDWTTEQRHLPGAALREHLVPNARVVMRLSNLETIRLAVAAGMGLGVLPSFFGRVCPTIVRLPEPNFDKNSSLYLVGHAAVRNTARVKAVWEHLVTFLRGTDEEQLEEGRTLLTRAYGVIFDETSGA
ncbi:MAG: LysR family transcriptional regulator [Nannocystales bacterium]